MAPPSAIAPQALEVVVPGALAIWGHLDQHAVVASHVQGVAIPFRIHVPGGRMEQFTAIGKVSTGASPHVSRMQPRRWRPWTSNSPPRRSATPCSRGSSPGIAPRTDDEVKAMLSRPLVRARLEGLGIGTLVLYTVRETPRETTPNMVCAGGFGAGACFGPGLPIP